MYFVVIQMVGHYNVGANKKLGSSTMRNMLEILVVFLVVFGVIGMFASYSIATLLSSCIVVALLMLVSNALPKSNKD